MSFLKLIKEVCQIFWSKVFTISCVYCARPGSYACNECSKIFFEEYDNLQADRFIAFRYNKAVAHLISLGKHQGFFEISHFQGLMLAKVVLNSPIIMTLLQGASLIPVPIAKAKLKQRGFNQVDQMIKGFQEAWIDAQRVSLPVLDLLKRTVSTETQIGKNKMKRQQALAKAFQVTLPRDFSKDLSNLPRKIVLVDDVYTTGSTIRACQKILSEFYELHDLSPPAISALIFASGT